VSVKRTFILFLTLVFAFFPAFGMHHTVHTFGGIFNILICPTYGQAFDKDNSFISFDASRQRQDAYKLREFPPPKAGILRLFPKHQNSIPIFERQKSPELTQMFSFINGNYSKNTTLSSPPAAGSSTYPMIKRKFDYKKASVIGGLNLAAITVGFNQAMNTWGKSKGKFHLKDDWKGDGLAQTDELSHFMWGYKMTQFLYSTYDWVGFSPKTSRALSLSESALILTLVEYPIDAYNPEQGLGVSDLIFDYLGVGMAVAKKHYSWLNDFDFKISWKKNIFSENKTPFAQTYEEYDNFIYWLTYRPKLFLPQKLVCFGFGYSVTHLGSTGSLQAGLRPFSLQSRDQGRPKREFYGGIGLSIPDFVSLFGKKLGDKSKFLGIMYPNVRVKL